MKYAITYSPEAQEGLAKLKRSEPASFKKAVKLLNEIADHPQTGTGHPEPLKGKPENRWSRQITKKHRLVRDALCARMGMSANAAMNVFAKAVVMYRKIPFEIKADS